MTENETDLGPAQWQPVAWMGSYGISGDVLDRKKKGILEEATQ